MGVQVPLLAYLFVLASEVWATASLTPSLGTCVSSNMRIFLIPLALAALMSGSPAQAYTGAECKSLWSETRTACREACDQAQLPRGVSGGRCRRACNRARGQFIRLCKRSGQVPVR